MALGHPEMVLGIHINMFLALPPSPESSVEKFQRYQRMDYDTQELENLERTRWFAHNEVSRTKQMTNCCLHLTGANHSAGISESKRQRT